MFGFLWVFWLTSFNAMLKFPDYSTAKPHIYLSSEEMSQSQKKHIRMTWQQDFVSAAAYLIEMAQNVLSENLVSLPMCTFLMYKN